MRESQDRTSGPVEPPRRGSTGTWRAARWVRRAVQVAALCLFVVLLFAAVQRHAAFPYADLFFRFDPLAAFGTMLAARSLLPHLALALVTVVAAIVVGRVWCGWLCPMGTILGWARFRGASRRAGRLPAGLRGVKYVLLIAILVMAALGSLTFLIFDPITLLTRTFTTSVIPGLDYVVNGVESALTGWAPGASAVTWFEGHVRGTVLPVYQPHYAQGVAIFVLFLAVVLLNALADRFWCRYLCPLGALLGLVAKVQVLRPIAGSTCDACGSCVRACRLDAIEDGATAPAHVSATEAAAPAPGAPRVVTSECTMCLDCLVACKREVGMTLGVARRPGPWVPAYDPGRREFVTATALGVGAVALFGTSVARAVKAPGLIRPPGAQDEGTLLSRCLRCSECIKVCPTSGLQPALFEAGLEGLWTPVLTSRLGYCDYACTACGHVCPSGAIPELGLEEKRRQVLGVAVIDRDRCLPWASDTPCIVCQEMCPVPDKAIELSGNHLITRADGTQDYLSRPKVVPGRCIGCGICEYKCPLEGPAAIRIRPSNPSLYDGAAPPAEG
jgi:polyferredoxin/formate hydrogenlyase subunit 6/NADH:ubiquinone oxidoreductase subunit I